MNINVKKTFRITGRNLFVIVTYADFYSLMGLKNVFDKQQKVSFPIFSVEWVNQSNLSMPGITVKYETDADLIFLEELAENFVVVE